MTPHDLIKHGQDQHECRLCAQTWLDIPTSSCPGVKVYSKKDYEPLMTLRQLGSNGYKITEKFIPPPVGCYLARDPDNYTMLYDPTQAVRRLNRSRPMTAHDLVKYGPGHYECRVCFKSWDKRPQTACPGIKVYERYDHAPLMTKDELNYMGYHATPKRLPPEVGCFYKESVSRYMPLYDPIQATPKIQFRVHGAITEILWPLNCLSLLEDLAEMQTLKAFSEQERARIQQLSTEVANIAALTGLYTRAELEEIHGGFIVFNIPPTILYRSYPAARMNMGEERRLQTNLLVAYRRYITLSQSPS